MAVTIKASGPRGAKTYEVRVDGELYHYTDTLAAARRSAAEARKKQKRKNPGRGVVKALRTLLKKANPAARITGASVVKLKGGVLKITPIKGNPGGGVYSVEHSGGRWGNFSTKKQADAYAKRMRAANKQAGNRSPVRVVKVK